MGTSKAQKLPGASAELLPKLAVEIDQYWPTLSPRSFPAGVIDQESGWKVNAKLKTSIEFGCGLGQFTQAYDKDGKVRMDALTDVRRLDTSLKNWSWADCYNTQLQMRSVVLKLKSNNRNCSVWVKGEQNVNACNASAYNGGMGGFSKRIRQCQITKGCDTKVWFGNLEKQCAASKVKVAGYGQSFCDINSEYPGRVFARMPKFELALKKP